MASANAIEAIGFKDVAPIQVDIQTGPVQTDSFVNMLDKGVSQVNESLKLADKVLQDLALDKPVNTHDVLLTMEKAKKELRLAVEVRNKLLEGYQEIMRMQV